MDHPAADDRVTTAISNWAPRFTTNGVTAGDFYRITRSLRSWDDWCGAWSVVAPFHRYLTADWAAERLGAMKAAS